MRSILIVFAVLASLAPSRARAERFDRATFSVPTGWTIQAADASVELKSADAKTYCVVKVLKSVATSGDAKADFDKDWRELVAGPFKITAAPKVTRPVVKGWTVHAAASKFTFNNQSADVALRTHVGGGSVVTVIAVGNDKRCAKPLAAFYKSLRLSDEASSTSTSGSAPDAAPASRGSGFQFTTSNFDEGWTATVQPDWVQLDMGDTRVFLHYAVPYNADLFSGTGVADRDYYWDNYVARQFQVTTKSYRDDGAMALKPKYVEGWAVDPVSKQKRFLAMYLSVAPNAAMITLASTADENTLRALFPKANDALQSDLASMSRFNKFAIGAKDLVGTWQSGGSQMTQWYDARTGAYTGATLAATSATFTFAGDGSYRSIHNGATGAVGNMGTFQQDYKGSYKVSNFAVTATKRYQGRTDTFDAHLQAVRGGRLLSLDDKRGGRYLLVRTKN